MISKVIRAAKPVPKLEPVLELVQVFESSQSKSFRELQFRDSIITFRAVKTVPRNRFVIVEPVPKIESLLEPVPKLKPFLTSSGFGTGSMKNR